MDKRKNDDKKCVSVLLYRLRANCYIVYKDNETQNTYIYIA